MANVEQTAAPAAKTSEGTDATSSEAESAYGWMRLAVAVLLMTIGGSGMFVVTVAIPFLQKEFGVARSTASLPFTFAMIGFGVGSIVLGRMADRFGVMIPVLLASVCVGLGYMAAGLSGNLGQFILAHGLLMSLLGGAATFGPLIADTSLWFTRRRGIAVGICASGNYLAGAIWPPIVQHFFSTVGWRETYFGMGIFCIVTMVPLAFLLRRRPPAVRVADTRSRPRAHVERPLGLSPGALQALLCVAGVACCVAMSMPQVHIVAYCGDLGYGPARGAEMLSLMLGFGILSRLTSGWICDRIGGLRTLLLGSALQGLALFLFIPFNGLVSLYVISAMFGLFQGGIVPSYAIIVGEHFDPAEAGARVGIVLTATMLGMALGGWMSGAIFDLTGSYRAAFVNGTLWNLLNLTIALSLLRRKRLLTALGSTSAIPSG
jgi:MFS family permease